MPGDTAIESAQTEMARRALEEVCSGKHLGGIPDVYHPEFVDHVNALEYRGHEGARRSVALYLELFPDLRFVVDEQVSEGDRVASRWTLHGTHRGRGVALRGIVTAASRTAGSSRTGPRATRWRSHASSASGARCCCSSGIASCCEIAASPAIADAGACRRRPRAPTER